MQQAGYECVGVHMRLTDQDNGAAAAREIADKLGIPFYECDLSERFHNQVIKPFVDGYVAGETPNPCIICNRQLKFGALLDIADELGCRYLATGHYARISYSDSYARWIVCKGVDASKDQSYVLYTLSQDQLSRVKLPLGAYHKSETREMAVRAGFPNAEKPDSQDICFIPDGNYAAFIESTIRATGMQSCPPGNMLDTDGNIVGQHKGLIRYTIGQRKGLGAHGRPVFVQSINAKQNTITIAAIEEAEALLHHQSFFARDPNWTALANAPQEPLVCTIKIGYKHTQHPGTIQAAKHRNAEYVQVIFDKPQRAITSGQAAVFYSAYSESDTEVVLGGGTIDSVLQ